MRNPRNWAIAAVVGGGLVIISLIAAIFAWWSPWMSGALLLVGAAIVAGALMLTLRRLRIQLHKAATRSANLSRSLQDARQKLAEAITEEHRSSVELVRHAETRGEQNFAQVRDRLDTGDVRARGHRAWLEATQVRISDVDKSVAKMFTVQESASQRAQEAAEQLAALEARETELEAHLHTSLQNLSRDGQELAKNVNSIGARQDEFEEASQKFGNLLSTLGQRQSDQDQRQANLTERHVELAKAFNEKPETAPEVLEALDRYQRNETVLRRKAKAAEAKLSDLGTQTSRLRRDLQGLQVREFERGVLEGHAPASAPATAQTLLPLALTHQSLPATLHLIREPGVLHKLNLTKLRELYRFVQRFGYWRDQLNIVQRIAHLSGNESDQFAEQRVSADIEMFTHPLRDLANGESGNGERDVHGPVLHVVGKSLPLTQTGYTLRTHYTVKAQDHLNIPVALAVQPGGDSAPDDVAIDPVVVHDGMTYHRLAGPARGELPLDQWLAVYADSLSDLVRDLRPSLLHAHSDFLNGAAAILAGRRNGVPVIYESRGFWEESWLSRVIDTIDIPGGTLAALESLGFPEAYELRRGAEEEVRQHADANVTLAEVMRAHIQDQHTTSSPSVTIAPNAVDTRVFAPLPKDSHLAGRLGISEDDVVVGYISSMVEYEGIDTLVDAFRHLAQSRGTDGLRLLLVGDGPTLPRLEALAEPLGDAAIFVGRVPHEDVQAYYSLIDIFVVPRRPTQVSHLVTPLKPFEAMAMGKALVMSDVKALSEIAQDSGAARTFRAGDPADLAEVLSDLVDEPASRAALGSAAQTWVGSHRTWASNAATYLSLYNRLGARWEASATREEAQRALREVGIEPFSVARAIKDSRPPTQGWFAVGEPKAAERVMAEGWRFAHHAPIALDEITDWSVFAQQDRSLAFNIHAWDFVDSFVWDGREPSEEEAQYLLKVIQSWNADRLSRENSGEDTMAYYDMSLALRTARLPHLIVMADSFASTTPHVPELVRLLLHDREALRRPEAFNPRTNHGFYTAAAQLHLEKYVPNLPDHEEVEAEGMARMAQLLATQFAEDGGHLEHSPEYHKMLLSSLSAAVDSGLISDERMVATIERGRAILGWMIQPNGELVPLGDSQQRPISKASALGEPTTLWIATDGQLGHPATEESLALPSSGYAFVRSPQPQVRGERLESSYLALQAGFHSRAHKHADDLSFVWFDRGQEICIDAGRYGYGELLAPTDPQRNDGFYYAGRERQYVESSRAHNTVELDGAIQNRRREPYGSALVEATREGKTFAITGRAAHDTFTHRRKLNLLPRTRLTVLDSFFSTTDQQRTATAWFLLDGSLTLVSQDERALVFGLSSGGTLQIATDEPIGDVVRGQDEPLLGWRSKRTGELEPAWSFGVNLTFATRGGIRTEFTFGD